MPTKKCTKCGEEKTPEEFNSSARSPDGKRWQCRECDRRYRSLPNVKARERELNQKPERKQRQHKYHKEYCQRTESKIKHNIRSQRYNKTPNRISYMEEYNKEYRSDPENKERRKFLDSLPENRKKQNERNKDPKNMEKHRIYERTPKGKMVKLRAANKRRAIKLNQNPESTLTIKQWKSILKYQKHICIICGKPFTKANPATKDHIIPIYHNGAFTMENTQAVHGSCNYSKGKKIDKNNIIVWLSKPELCVN